MGAHASGKTCLEDSFILHGQVCTPYCADGWFPSLAKLTCFNGTFTPGIFTCTGPCAQPVGIPNGAIKTSGRTAGASFVCAEGPWITHGSYCSALCADGYVPEPSTLDCSFSVLTPPTFACVGGFCVEPGGVANAPLAECAEGLTIPHGGLCTTICNIGFAPSATVLDCEFGSLNPPTYTCDGAPCAAPGLAKASERAPCAEGSVIDHGGYCTAVCDEGYIPSFPRLRCEYGLLKPSVFSCDSAFAHALDHRRLVAAAATSDAAAIEGLLRSGVDAAAARSAGGGTALSVAALHDAGGILELMLASRADPNVPDGRGWTALHVAAGRGHYGAVEALVNSGGNALARDGKGRTPRDIAALVGLDISGALFRTLAEAERREFDQACAHGRGDLEGLKCARVLPILEPMAPENVENAANVTNATILYFNVTGNATWRWSGSNSANSTSGSEA